MGDDSQSIEDLIKSSQGEPAKEGSSLQKFQAKSRQIQIKDLERATQAQAKDWDLPYINLFGFPISPDALSLIPEDEARENGVVCFYFDGKKLKFGAVDPRREPALALVEKTTKERRMQSELYLISKNSLDYAMKLYKSIPKVREVSRGVELTQEELDKFSEKFSSFRDLQSEIDQARVTDIVAMIMAASIKSNASDIHVEAEEKSIKIRFRIDGVLHDAAQIDRELWKKIISRMKVLAKVKINVTDKPQDGRLSLYTSDERIDVRASFLPTNYGESVVMRILRSSAVGLEFDQLGLRGKAYEKLKREIGRPNGMVITTGPTGSGKTTTLYAVLKKLNNQETKIITIEDPIEYQLEGVNQSQTSENYTFSQGLKSIVRQDPDVIMVGEIRDLDTAEIAIQAALTGHLVLSTIHTNDAAGTVPRFVSMGAKPFLLAPALNTMIGQRLVRRLCEQCKKEQALDEEVLRRVKKSLSELPEEERANVVLDNIKGYVGQGCEACQGIGYKGRIGIYEIISVDKEIEEMILSGKASEYDMRQAAADKGVVTMVQDGLLKALDGITSFEEVFRVAKD